MIDGFQVSSLKASYSHADRYRWFIVHDVSAFTTRHLLSSETHANFNVAPNRRHSSFRHGNTRRAARHQRSDKTRFSSCCRDASGLRLARYNEPSDSCSSPGAGTPWSESGEMGECLKTLEEPWAGSIIQVYQRSHARLGSGIVMLDILCTDNERHGGSAMLGLWQHVPISLLLLRVYMMRTETGDMAPCGVLLEDCSKHIAACTHAGVAVTRMYLDGHSIDQRVRSQILQVHEA
ncbi:hypothetical protein AB1N83_012052 [Pleurotus pulmonarius]